MQIANGSQDFTYSNDLHNLKQIQNSYYA